MKYKWMFFKLRLKNTIKRLRGIKDLDNDGIIESVREEVQGVFQQFLDMRDSMDIANAKLTEVTEDELQKQVAEQKALEHLIQETNQKLEASANRVAKAENEIRANNRLKEKVSEFIAE